MLLIYECCVNHTHVKIFTWFFPPCIFLYPLKILGKISSLLMVIYPLVGSKFLRAAGVPWWVWKTKRIFLKGDHMIHTWFPRKVSLVVMLGWFEGAKTGASVVLMKMGKKLRSGFQALPSVRSTCSQLSLAAYRKNLSTLHFSLSLLFPLGTDKK